MYFADHQGADLLNEAIVLRVMNGAGAEADHLRCLLEASKHRQIVLVKEENGELLASLAFAMISKCTLRLLASNADHKLRPYEYREGKVLYVIDGFFGKRRFRRSMTLLATQLRRYRLIAYVKDGRLRVFYNNSGSLRFVNLSTS